MIQITKLALLAQLELTADFNNKIYSVRPRMLKLKFKQRKTTSMGEYIETLRNYLIWADTVKRKYGWNPGRQFDDINLTDEDFAANRHWFELLSAMEFDLKLTDVQIEEIQKTL